MPRYKKEEIGKIHRVTKVKTFGDHVKEFLHAVIGISIFVAIGAIFF